MINNLPGKICILFLIIFTAGPVSIAQLKGGVDGKFNDSLPFSKIDPYFVSDLSELAHPIVIDTIYKPYGFVIKTYPFRAAAEVVLAIKKKGGYQVFVVHGFETHDAPDDSIVISRIDFNGKGTQELLIKYAHTSGRNLDTHGWDEWQEGFIIWDIDKAICLSAFENYRCSTGWWREFDLNEPDSLAYEERTVVKSGGDSSCTSYRYTIKKGTILFERNALCNINDVEILVPADKPQRVRYRLGKEALIKVQ